MVRATCVCALLMLAPVAATAQTYKCKRPDGKTSFQDQPCEAGAKEAEVFLSDPSPAPLDAPSKPAPPERAAKRGKVPVAEKNTADEALKERNRQLEAQNRAMACSMARRNLNVLREQRPVYRVEGNKKVYVEDANRQSEIAAAQRSVSESCK